METKVHYRVPNSQPLDLMLTHKNPVDTLTPVSLRFILILYSHVHLGSPRDLFPSGIRTEFFINFSHSFYMHRPSQ
jgi:hypothetical protein